MPIWRRFVIYVLFSSTFGKPSMFQNDHRAGSVSQEPLVFLGPNGTKNSPRLIWPVKSLGAPDFTAHTQLMCALPSRLLIANEGETRSSTFRWPLPPAQSNQWSVRLWLTVWVLQLAIRPQSTGRKESEKFAEQVFLLLSVDPPPAYLHSARAENNGDVRFLSHSAVITKILSPSSKGLASCDYS